MMCRDKYSKATLCFAAKSQLLIVLSVIFSLTACSNGGDDSNTVIVGPGDVTYEMRFIATWSAATHPDDFPSSAHFSGLIGASHNASVLFWEAAAQASPGIESMAETGSKSALIDEVEQAMSTGNADKIISAAGLGASPGNIDITFPMQSSHPYISIVTMLAPSPDWFAGVSAINLMENGDWLPSKTVELFVYDAGTDDGVSYTSSDADSNPKQAIMKISESPFFVNGQIRSVGQFVFQKQ